MKRTISVRAFSLVEVTLAIGIAAFCLVSIFGLLPAGLNGNQASVRETAASRLTAAIASDLRATSESGGAANSPLYEIGVPASGQSNTTVVFLKEDGSKAELGGQGMPPMFRAAVVVDSPSSPSRAAATARILITWPAQLSPSTSGLPSKFTGSLETVVTLDRS